MRSRDISSWMWSEALSMLDRAERLQHQFFVQVSPAWEPPVDVIEDGAAVHVHVALPGVRPESVTLAFDAGGFTVSALRAFPLREGESAHIHRVEIPYGRFVRRIDLPLDDPYSPLELARKTLADGVLMLTFHRKEGA